MATVTSGLVDAIKKTPNMYVWRKRLTKRAQLNYSPRTFAAEL
jgi:hypothetical protein